MTNAESKELAAHNKDHLNVDISLNQAIQILSKSSGYKIELQGRNPENVLLGRKSITQLSISGLIDSLKQQNISFAMEVDRANKKLKIILIGNNLGNEALNSKGVLASDDIVLPASKYGPALTLGELRRIKAEHRAKMKLQTDATEILPASKYGPALTLGELRKIMAEHHAKMKLQTDATELLPPTKNGPGLTVGELRKIEAEHRAKMENLPDQLGASPG